MPGTGPPSPHASGGNTVGAAQTLFRDFVSISPMSFFNILGRKMGSRHDTGFQVGKQTHQKSFTKNPLGNHKGSQE